MTFDPYQGVRTNFTKVTHRKPYPTIDVTRPELSQTGKTLLITGGATNIGLLIVKKFIEAGVAKVIIVARRQNVLDDAAAQLREQYGDKTAVLTKQCDQTNREAVSKLWLGLRDEGLEVDILVLNAATFSYAKPLLELGADEMRNAIETNVLGPIDLIEGFNAQPGDSRRVILSVSSEVSHMLADSQLAVSGERPIYGMTKCMMNLLAQQIAKDVLPEKLQIISFHPGLLHNDEFTRMGIDKDGLPFDDPELPGSFAVWASTPEAAFLHGRFVWAAWDIDEYSNGEDRKRFETDEDFLRVSLGGISGAFRV